MSTSPSPSAASSAEYAEHLSNLIAVPSLSDENHYFLGPVGNLDPTEFIIGETNRIPFRLANLDLGHWKNTFKSWPSLEKTSPEKSWITWYKRMSSNKKVHWDEIGIGQALTLTIANSAKDEPLMAAATYFWSNTINAFLFNQGPMTPTLIDITMITGLDVTSLPNPTWLNLMVMKVVNRPSVIEAEFLRLEPIIEDDGEERTHRKCTSYRGYASTLADTGAKLSAELLKDWFCSFYEGFQKDAPIWFPYEDSALLELPSDFRFEDINHERYEKSREVFSAAISPCILPVGIHQGRNIQVSYEFYHPMSSARQLGMGQLPIGLFFADKIQCRGEISSTLMMDRLLNLEGPPLGSIENIELARFRNLFPDVVPQTTESSPPRKSNSGIDIEYAPGLIPNGGGSSPPVINCHAPKTSSMLQGLIRELADAGKKRKTRASAIDPLAPAPNKKAKSNKTKPTDDLSAVDPSIEQALDEEDIGEDVDQAEAGISEKENYYEKEIGSNNSQTGSTIQALIPEEHADVLTPAAYLEQYQFKLEKAKLRLAERRERRDIEATIQANRQLVHEEKSKLDQLSEGPIKSNIDQLEARKIELLAQLQECNADMTKSLKVISGTDAQDTQAIEEVEHIRQRAISAI
uniref:OSJNBb0068N06.5 protein n=1 Tax=Oryza sativa subsp. japonica TaxID=39947 RepID=Q7XNM5_ORYSJ|nr:OSJNBb0068N06.5 [Oryza sativa Japonica Group]